MVQNKSGTKMLESLLIAASAGVAVTIVAAMIAAVMMASGSIAVGAEGIVSLAAILLGAVTTGVLSVGKCPEKGLIVCLSAAGVYWLTLAVIAIASFDGVKQGVIPTLAVVFGGAIAVYFTSLNRCRRTKYKKVRVRR